MLAFRDADLLNSAYNVKVRRKIFWLFEIAWNVIVRGGGETGPL